MILSLLWLASLIVVSVGISVVNPLDEQLPLIARVGEYYNWSISPVTFSTNLDASLTASIPDWLSFDSNTRSFSGTPTFEDQGESEISVTAHEASSSATSSCNIYVTTAQAPTLNIALEQQFYEGNPSLSSVFVVSSNSSLYNGIPTLRIPNSWSFSIGISSETFKDNTQAGDPFYNVLLLDGSPLWNFQALNTIDWNRHDLTLDGLAPPHDVAPSPATYHLALHASDKAGYTANVLPFDIVIADHDLSKNCSTLPTSNVTAHTSFNFSLSSPSDFVGVLIDGHPIHPSNISGLDVDTSGRDGLKYDASSRTLSGIDLQATQDLHLPVTLTAMNQTLHTRLSLSVVPSFFVDTLPNVTAPEDGTVSFSLQPYFSNSTGQSPANVDVGVSFDVPEVADHLIYDSSSFTLQGALPADLECTIISATFTAYDHITHTTSHATSFILCPAENSKGNRHHGSGLFLTNNRKLVLGLSISFGLIGGVCALAVLLAAFRRCSRVQDTAVTGDEAQRWWSETDKKWYGLEQENGYGWTRDTEKQESDDDSVSSLKAYGNLGLGIGLPSNTRSSIPQSNLCSVGSTVQSSGLMKKGEFLHRIRETVRHVSDRYNSTRNKQPTRLPIGKPILLNASPAAQAKSLNSLADGSPADIPSPATVHFVDQLPRSRHLSVDSSESFASIQTHANEAVVHTATRVPSICHPSVPESLRIGQGPPAQPRLVPFTSATRVPVPQTPGSSPESNSVAGSARITSQTATATVWQKYDEENSPSGSGSSDDLSVGIEYVRALGSDTMPVDNATSTFTVSTNMRSSFSSFDPSESGHERERSMRMIVRAGEDFKFRVTLPPTGSPRSAQYEKLAARLVSGESLPRFLHVDLHSNKRSGGIEFYGAASVSDVGDFEIVVCSTKDSETCLARVLLQVAGNA
ncbi:hypothetical protein K435DRAFT_965281 [Dendrothele bispora CBS 962.96]|uniref:Dystroglycan-type cadherin-like domain-containing protein n=1 Tax=Dendrothele bispora (strain CBS 962.96) TaxID=1314807 RepID=A0A4S8M7G2_DENBC|nr:hypothetical protein K435DRAFT_965281 [Dendrothele bispora CBS 962.96]